MDVIYEFKRNLLLSFANKASSIYITHCTTLNVSTNYQRKFCCSGKLLYFCKQYD